MWLARFITTALSPLRSALTWVNSWRRQPAHRATEASRTPVRANSNTTTPPKPQTTAPDAAHVIAAGLVPPPEPPAPAAVLPTGGNRAARRAQKSRERRIYEKKRKQFDQWVEPKGEQPVRKVRAEPEVTAPVTPVEIKPAETAMEFVDDGHELLCIDKHHSDRTTDVLYVEDEFYGEFNFRDTILEQLDRHFFYLRRMRRNDGDSYGFYREIGATLLPYACIPDIWVKDTDPEAYNKKRSQLSAWFLQNRPAFGCVSYGANPEIERIELEAGFNKDGGTKKIVPRFMYFTKYQHPPATFQPMSGGDIYKMTVWWDTHVTRRIKHGVPQDFAIFVGNDGSVRALKILETQMTRVRSRKGYVDIPNRNWRVPSCYDSWAKEHHTTSATLLRELFVDLANSLERASWSIIRVDVEKGGEHAAFGVDIHRTPYFFRDRDIELTDSGSRKRIFHMVRPQVRKDGTAVRMHFRGQREFSWAGYNVKITVPGRDHFLPGEFNIGTTDEQWREPDKKYLTEPEIGQKLRKWMNEGVGGRHV